MGFPEAQMIGVRVETVHVISMPKQTSRLRSA
jgi:hypothetical protein